ncbi:MAG: sulfite exporter TauE/SafE family protein [Epsilonproteobacteria bacterium]|nr:sulfite exporter TauE/SafE family protein [Campylobacterota bacterium]
MAGIGSAVALVPILNLMGIDLNQAKTIGLFVNTSSTLSAAILNLKRKTIAFKIALPLIITSSLFSPMGAYLSQYINEDIVKILLSLFLISSATMMLIPKKASHTTPKHHGLILYAIGSVVGFFSGILGIGGGAYIMLALIFLGYDAKKVAYAVTLVIPFSTFFAFLTYLSFAKINFTLLFICAVAAIIGGLIGSSMMHHKLQSKHIKKLIIIILYLTALKLITSLG